MSTKTKYLIFIVNAILLVSCTPVPYIHIWNNSGCSITVSSESTSVTIYNSSHNKIKYPGYSKTLRIITERNEKWDYEVLKLVNDYIINQQVYAQLESDGKLFVFPHKVKHLEKVPSAQPVGYPLTPKLFQNSGIIHSDIRH